MQTSGRREAEKAFDKARLPQDFSAHGELNNDDSPFLHNFFKCQNDMLKVLARSVGFDLSMIVVKLAEGEALTVEERQQVSLLFREVAQTTLRKTDQMFDIRQESSEINIVLPGTKAEKAEVVIEKLRDALQMQKDKMVERGKLTFSVETLHKTSFVAA